MTARELMAFKIFSEINGMWEALNTMDIFEWEDVPYYVKLALNEKTAELERLQKSIEDGELEQSETVGEA